MIRKYQEKDREAVQLICAGEKPEEPEKLAWWSACFEVFARYYIEQEPENCFVAADEKDCAVGYVLCAADFSVWERQFTKLYLEPAENPMAKMMGQGTIEGLRKFAPEHPAHLHIDLAPSAQRKGLGTKLLDALTASLRERQVPGIQLGVALDNTGAQMFYKKYGFCELERTENQITMGLKL